MKDYFRTIKMAVGYNGKPLMEQIEIGLSKGEILTLIGPNGSGKSTILKSIAGQLALLGGTIMLGSSHLEEMSLSRRAQTMAVLLTERLRTEMMTCEDVVATGRYPYTGRFGVLSAKDHEAVQEAMEAVHVLEFRDRDFAKISDGQRQRILLARALCQQPELIVRRAAVQRHGEPAVLVHMVGRENPRLTPQRTDEDRITLEVHHVDHLRTGQTELIARHVQNQRKPFPVAAVPEHGMVRRIGPRIVRLCAVMIEYIPLQLVSGHCAPSPLRYSAVIATLMTPSSRFSKMR